MARMTLDVKYRLILSNQYRILEALYPDEAADFARARKIVESGWELSYDWIIGHIDPDPMDEEDCKEVLEILDMHRHVIDSYNGLADKGGIEPHQVQFHGFDGNNESEYLAYAAFLHDEGKYAELSPANSHMPTLATYRRMLSAWTPFKHKERLTRGDIEGILAARVHPDNR